MCGLWVFAMLHYSLSDSAVGVLCGVLSVAVTSLPFAQAMLPGFDASFISVGSQAVGFVVIWWLLMVHTPRTEAQRAEERKAWADERNSMFQRHAVEMDREREECEASKKQLNDRIDQLEARFDHLGEKVV